MKKTAAVIMSILLMLTAFCCFASGCAAGSEPKKPQTVPMPEYTPPAGFTADADKEGRYLASGDDLSSIVIGTDDRTTDFDRASADYFKNNCLDQLAYAADVDPEDIEYSMNDVMVSGREAIKITAKYTINETMPDEAQVVQVQYVIRANDNTLWMYTLTQVGEFDHIADFARSVQG